VATRPHSPQNSEPDLPERASPTPPLPTAVIEFAGEAIHADEGVIPTDDITDRDPDAHADVHGGTATPPQLPSVTNHIPHPYPRSSALSVLAPTLVRMSPDSISRGSVRSAADLNDQIRALWRRAGGSLSSQERAEYELLVVEWAAAIRGEVIEAA
jgi:hypothetical protein